MTSKQILSIVQDLDLDTKLREYLQDSDEFEAPLNCYLTDFYEEYDFDEDEERVLALMEHTGDEYDYCYNKWDDCYLVYTDDEANEAWEEALDHYLDDCVLPELPESAQQYFNIDDWKSDAKYDGRGHSLSMYDGEEHEVTIKGTDYYIYRLY